tara:strand:- start:1120 stop:1239 length:120 start_codon:yes stop_codon:yes gene_type:complete
VNLKFGADFNGLDSGEAHETAKRKIEINKSRLNIFNFIK